MKTSKRSPSLHGAIGALLLTSAATLAPSFAAVPAKLCEAGPLPAEQTRFTQAQLADGLLGLAERLGAQLMTSKDGKQQALAHYLQADARADRAANALRQKRQDCDLDRTCAAQLKKERAAARAPDLRALNTLAVNGNDAQTYALAYTQCSTLPPEARDPSCGAINAQTWRKLAPQRAEPLVALAVEAWQKGDSDALDGALRAVVQLPGNHSARAPLHSLRATSAVNALAQHERGLAALLITAGNPTYALAPLTMHYCAARELLAPERKQLCGDLADKMVDKTGLLLDNIEGRRIGKAVGWSKERLAASREVGAMKKSIRYHLAASENSSCAYLDRLENVAQATLDQGETAAYATFFTTEKSLRK